MKKNFVWVLIGIVILLGLILVYLIKSHRISSSAAGPVASLALSPASGTYPLGGTFDVAINLNTGGASVDGVDIVKLHYPAASLKATTVKTGGITAFSISPSPVTPDNTAGTITFVSYVATGSAGYSGSGSIAIVTFQALAATSAAKITFDFNASVPSTTDCNVAEHSTGNDILGSVVNGSYAIQNVNTINISFKLQGRTDNSSSGTVLTIYNAGTSTVAYSKSDITSGATGNASFTVNGLAAGSYDFKIKTTRNISSKITNTVLTNPISLNFGILKAGDLNNDDIVNSLDFSLLNSKWLQADLIADINGDQIVNTIDYAILNGNWLAAGQ